MIPYFRAPDIVIPLPFSLFGAEQITLHAFGLLVAIAVLVGHWQAMRYAGKHGTSQERLAHMIAPMLVAGFVMAHLFTVIFYRPEDFWTDWWKIWDGLSSFGGFFGALLALLVYRQIYRVRLLPYADAIVWGLAHGWIFGRAGCAVVHDHPGRLTTFPLSIDFPEHTRMAGQRFDLGLLEMLYTIALVIVLRRLVEPRVSRAGEMAAWGVLLYAPARFLLDFLRAADIVGADARYAGLTPAQYSAVVAALGCAALLVWLRRRPAAEAGPEAEAASPAGGRGRRKRAVKR
jgi:phosphatidylglycerol---prolipoprotein diacylglyceryl transferase